MSWKRKTMPILGFILVLAAALLVGAAMYVADEHEETAKLYSDYRAMKMASRDKDKREREGDNRGMKLRGHWGGLVVAGAEPPPTFPGGPAPSATGGVAIVGIETPSGNRARNAGLRAGDVIVALDQKPVNDLADMYTRSQGATPGQPVLFDVQRQGQLVTIVVPPDPMAMTQAMPTAAAGPALYCPKDGILVPPVTAAGTAQHQCPVCRGPLYRYSSQPGTPR